MNESNYENKPLCFTCTLLCSTTRFVISYSGILQGTAGRIICRILNYSRQQYGQRSDTKVVSKYVTINIRNPRSQFSLDVRRTYAETLQPNVCEKRWYCPVHVLHVGMEGEIALYLHSFVKPALDMSGQLHALVALLLAKDNGTHWIGSYVGPRAHLDSLEKRKISYLCPESNPGPSSP